MATLARALVWALLLCVAFAPSAHAWERASTRVVAIADLPLEARQTLERIKKGGPFPYRNDGTTFGNRERRLPQHEHGYYREYTVPTPGARDRGGRRIVAGRNAEYYYTDDHYDSFRRIRE